MAAAHWAVGPALSLLALGALGTGVAFVLTTTAAGNLRPAGPVVPVPVPVRAGGGRRG